MRQLKFYFIRIRPAFAAADCPATIPSGFAVALIYRRAFRRFLLCGEAMAACAAASRAIGTRNGEALT